MCRALVKMEVNMFICRSIHDELQPPPDIIPDNPGVNWVNTPMLLFKESCVNVHFTKFVAFMMWLRKNFSEHEGRYHYGMIKRRFGWSFPSIASLFWHRLILIWCKDKPAGKIMKMKIRHHSRDIRG